MLNLLVDCDPAAGVPMCDVDDVLALHLLVQAGVRPTITTCYGNTSGKRTFAVAKELGERWGLPVHRGADRPGDTATAAVDALVAHTGTVMAIAPMTNIAAALARGARWERLVLLGGTARTSLNLRYVHMTELNFALDEPAAARALEACTTLFPMEVCRQVRFGAAEVATLPPWLQARVRGWLRLAPLMTGKAGFHPWDVLPALWLLEPALFTTERLGVRLAGLPGRRGSLRYQPGAMEVVMGVDAAAMIRSWSAAVVVR